MKLAQILVEIAARSKFEDFGEAHGCKGYRFDTRQVDGDFTIIRVPTPFACEEAARLKLYEHLVECFADDLKIAA